MNVSALSILPEDADGDGLIDHLIVYCRHGFSRAARWRLDRLNRLWLIHGRADDEGERSRTEWRLALEDIASPQAFGQASPLLRPSCIWSGITPYLMPWHAKRNFGVVEQITREITRRGISTALPDVTVPDQRILPKRAIMFRRARSRRGLVQPDVLGCFVTLTFPEPTAGPLALGFACHLACSPPWMPPSMPDDEPLERHLSAPGACNMIFVYKGYGACFTAMPFERPGDAGESTPARIRATP